VKTIVLTLTKEQKQFFADTGRTGGRTRAKKLTAARRREIARIASKAAAKKRMQETARRDKSK
jgi:hypothetical protein